VACESCGGAERRIQDGALRRRRGEERSWQGNGEGREVVVMGRRRELAGGGRGEQGDKGRRGVNRG
jgi:hypothetical protein